MCFIAAASNADDSTASRPHEGAGTLKMQSTWSVMDDFGKCRQPSYLAAVVGNSDASEGSSHSCTSAPGNPTTQDASNEPLDRVLRESPMTDKNIYQWNKHSVSSKNQIKMTSAKCEMPADVTAAKLHTRSFSDLAQWLQNGEEDVTTANYIDRRVVESVLKCRQLGKQCPLKKSSSQPACQRPNYFTNPGMSSGVNCGGREAGQHGQCRPKVTDDLYQEFGGKLETEADGDSGFSGDRNSASSTSSGLSIESSLTSLGSVTDFWSGNQSSSASETSVLSADQSTLQHGASVSHISDPVPSRTASLANISSCSTSQVASDVQNNPLLSEQPYGLLPRQKTLEPSSNSSLLTSMSSTPSHQPPPSVSKSGWCRSDGFFKLLSLVTCLDLFETVSHLQTNT